MDTRNRVKIPQIATIQNEIKKISLQSGVASFSHLECVTEASGGESAMAECSIRKAACRQ